MAFLENESNLGWPGSRRREFRTWGGEMSLHFQDALSGLGRSAIGSVEVDGIQQGPQLRQYEVDSLASSPYTSPIGSGGVPGSENYLG